MGKAKADLIAADLAAKIRHGQFKADDYLPSENQLVDLYGSSRETVRKALANLNDIGMIQKIKGKGSIVLDLDRYSFPLSGITSFAELNRSLAMRARTEVLQLKEMDDVPELMRDHFNHLESHRGFYLERLRIIDGEPSVLDCDFLFNPPVTKLSESAAKKSLYDYLENQLKLDISYGVKEITYSHIKMDIQHKLRLDHPNAILVASRNFLADTTPFQLTLSFHNPDKFKFVDFARRQKIKF